MMDEASDPMEMEFERYLPKVKMICNSLMRNRPELSSFRQDVLSDGIEITLRMIKTGGIGDEEFEKALGRDLQRTIRKYSPKKEDLAESEFLENAQDPAVDVVEIIDSKMLSDVLRDCISSLPRKQMIAVAMYYHLGMTQKEAAKMLGIKQAGFSRRLERARKHIAEEMIKMGISPSE